MYQVDSKGWEILLLVLVGVVNLALVIAFVVAAANIARIERMLSGQLTGIRGCPFCRSIIPPEASVCRSCTRDVGAWVSHGGTWWSREGASWRYLDGSAWRSPDEQHRPPSDPSPDNPGTAPDTR
jgi:hypothetical protein